MAQYRACNDAERQTFEKLKNLPPDWTALRLYNVSTDDKAVADTYADMLAKREELHPRATLPPTLGEMFGLATAYLTRSGVTPQFKTAKPSLCKYFPIGTTFGTKGSPLTLGLANSPRKAVSAGDRIVLLRRDEKSKFAEFCSTEQVRHAVKWEHTVDADGILPTLLPCFSGIGFYLQSLGDLSAPTPLDRLFMPLRNAVLVLLDGEDLNTVKETAETYSVGAVQIGVLIDRPEYLFAYDNTEILRVDTAGLRSLLPKAQADIAIPIDRSSASSLRRLTASHNARPAERIAVGSVTVSSAVRTIDGDRFRSALQTVLAPILSLASSGADYENIKLAVGLRMPTPKTVADYSNLLAVIVGIYRAEAEFACPAVLYAETNDSLSDVQLTAYAVTENAKPLPLCYQSAGSAVWCVTPAYTSDRIPDFANLRQLLRDMRTMAINGKIFSSRAVVSESLESRNLASQDSLMCRLSEGQNPTLSLGFLVEGTQLPFVRVGTVISAPPKSTDVRSDTDEI